MARCPLNGLWPLGEEETRYRVEISKEYNCVVSRNMVCFFFMEYLKPLAPQGFARYWECSGRRE
jgi:hypothetical protein